MSSSTTQPAFFYRLDTPLKRCARPSAQHVVVVCKTQPGHAEEGFGQQALDTLFERLSKTHPAFVYDGRELKGDEVRLYLLSDEAWSLAASLARALSELNAYRGSLVLVCSDLGERLGEYAVS